MANLRLLTDRVKTIPIITTNSVKKEYDTPLFKMIYNKYIKTNNCIYILLMYVVKLIN